MASDSDGSDVEEYSGMEQPPLIKQLTTILSEYPDDGQIIKELVQNAEDAGATQMKILYDGRQLNPSTQEKKLDKFFKGPALCFWNNAQFSKDDWRGIQMIYSSVKEKDPLKIGRFGLGFKSVFHLTDYPVILSGDRIVLMNPCERNPEKVCVTIKLNRLRNSRNLTTDHFLEALDGTFGFTADTLSSGIYSGTIFWFPLRETKSRLSDTIYKEDQILDLCQSFQSDADSMLLFLNSLQEVQAFVHKTCSSGKSHGIDVYDYGTGEPFFTVKLDNNVDEVVEKRKQNTTAIRNVRGVAEQSIISSAIVTYTTVLRRKDRTGVESNSRTWLVANYLKGGEMSDKLKTLILDTSLSYMPYVGVATPLAQSPNFKGHIYCFLPLPQEQHSLTGLPVHVNGFFALSQNRRHLKWPSADQVEYGMHTDKSISWNLELVQHVLPSAYLALLQEAATVGSTPEMVYRCIPNAEKVEDHWKPLLKMLLHKAVLKKLLYTENNGGCWIYYKDALFMDAQDVNSFGPEKIESIKKFLRADGQNLVDAPAHVVEALKLVENPRIITPAMVCGLLKQRATYRQMSSVEKSHLLEFLLRDGNLENVKDLQLLPLQDGTFDTFSNRHTKYLVSAKDIELFPGLEANFVKVDTSAVIQDHLEKMQVKGWYGLKKLTLFTVVDMLKESIANVFGTTTPITIRSNQYGIWAVWVKDVWAYISSHYTSNVNEFRDLPIFPVVSTGDWTTMQQFKLHKLTDILIKTTSKGYVFQTCMPEEVSRVLSLLSVVLIPSVPKWLRSDLIQQFVPDPSPESVCRLLGKLPMKAAEVFNRNVSDEGRIQLVKYVYRCSIPADAIQLMRRLQIFRQKSKYKGEHEWTSLDDNNQVLCQEDFPVHYPKKYIVPSTEEKQLADSLRASSVNQKNLSMEVLNVIQHRQMHQYDSNEVDTFMKWVLTQRFHDSDQDIHKLAKSTYFVKSSDGKYYRPCDLYDPTEVSLTNLFHNEHKFPADVSYRKQNMLHALRKLGLKSKSDLTAMDIQWTAQLLDSNVRAGYTGRALKQKGEALCMLLEENPHLRSRCDISDLHCIPCQEERHPHFPESVQWFRTPFSLCRPSELKSYGEYSVLIGSVLPVVECKLLSETATHFGWTDPPKVSEIVNNLYNIVMQYQSSQKAQFVTVIVEIYKYLSQRLASDVQKQLEMAFKDVGNIYVWCGDGFLAPDDIYTAPSTSDIDLKPYLFPLPIELWEFKPFFLSLGCYQYQDDDVLQKTLTQISKHHEHGNAVRFKKDLVVVVNILNRLRDISEAHDIETSDVLFPVHTGSVAKLVMKKSSLCTFCDAQSLKDVDSTEDDEDGIVYVHGDVPNSTADKLGVKSLTQRIMSDTEGLEEWGQTEPLTRRLHNLLKEGYVDGFSIPKELFQNADDAGAQKIWFLYDERENTDARTCLIDEGMEDCQGPAIWVYNDAEFSDEDFRDITRFSGGTKEQDAAKIGRFGLGFSSVYNLTDVPSFVSGANVVIFDPHMTHLGKSFQGKSPGLKIDLQKMKNLNMMKKFNNQFKPFEGIFGCNLTSRQPYFKGTLFRFPLRTHAQAKSSDICNIEYSRRECEKLLKLFIESAGNLMLFNQNVKDLRLYHIPASGVDPANPRLIFSATKTELPVGNSLPGDNSILSTVASYKERRSLIDNPCQELRRIQITMNVEEQDLLENICQSISQVQWLLSWASGIEKESVTMAYKHSGAIPLGSVAIPVTQVQQGLLPQELTSMPMGFYRTSHLFCFMPLPITTDVLPFHVNGSFAVSSDRRQLRHETEDDKAVSLKEWNVSLLKDAVCRSFMYLLSSMRDVDLSDKYCFHQLWPQGCEEILKKFQDKFYQNAILSSSRIFERNRVWLEFSQCLFLDQSLRDDEEVWDVAFEVSSHFQDAATVIDIPLSIFKDLMAANSLAVSSRTVTKEKFFVEILLPNLNSKFFDTPCQKLKRDTLILYALTMKNDAIDDGLRVVDCIPTQPFGMLQKPSFLVHNTGPISSLFSIDDGRFTEPLFGNLTVQERLVQLGMMKDTIPGTLVTDRAYSIQSLASTCGNCAMDRCSNLMKYLRKVLRKSDVAEAVRCLRDIPFLPVMEKPGDWPLHWHAETIDCVVDGSTKSCRNKPCSQEQENAKVLSLRLASPSSMFDSDCVNLVSTFAIVLDRERIKINVNRFLFADEYSSLLQYLGISCKDSIAVQSVINQLLHISRDFSESGMVTVPSSVKSVCVSLYNHLNAMCSNNNEVAKIVSQLKDAAIICLSHKFICPNITSIHLKTECSPYMYSINGHSINVCTALCGSLQIKSQFTAVEIGQVLVQLKGKYEETCLDEEEIDLACNIIVELVDALEREHMQLVELCDKVPGVYAPNVHGVLTLTTDMCFNDCVDIESSDSMVYIHDKVSPHGAKLLGVKTKRDQNLQDTSEEIGFFQNEPLVTRLKGLLSGYPCDTGLFKELLQNADDAKATELHFIKDYRHHETVSGFGESLQGPALCVYNNSSFTKGDLKGIQNLGTGSKREDPSKTGQFGVGFNAVYNLTDVPSFLTKGQDVEHGETLCMFDPFANSVPHTSREKPGRRFVNVNNLRKNHTCILNGYHEDIFVNGYGTMFRFPLRKHESEISRHCCSTKSIDEMFAEYRKELMQTLLFLKNMRKITVSNITSGELKEEYSVHVSLSEQGEAERKQYFEYHKHFTEQFKASHISILTLDSREVSYEMEIKDTNNTKQHWFVVQRIGYTAGQHPPEVVKQEYVSGELGLLPQGGVAVCLDKREPTWPTNEVNEHKAFCFLPMPITTGLPVNVNGHFALDEARRSLWKSENYDSCHRTQWNKSLLKLVVAPCYVTVLNHLKRHLFDMLGEKLHPEDTINDRLKEFEAYFPCGISVKDEYWQQLAHNVFQYIVDGCEELLPCVHKQRQLERWSAKPTVMMKITWTSLNVKGHKFPAYFSEDDISVSLLSTLQRLGLRLISNTEHMYKALNEAGRNAQQLSANVVIQFLKSFCIEVEDRCKLVVDVPVEQTVLNSVEHAAEVLTYCTKSKCFLDCLENLPLLVTNDGTIKQFSVHTPVFLTEYCDLFPDDGHMFLHQLLGRTLYNTKTPFKSEVFRKFSLNEFSQRLHNHSLAELLSGGGTVEFNPISKTLPNQYWIQHIWDFLYAESVRMVTVNCSLEKAEHCGDLLRHFEKSITCLGQWALVPTSTHSQLNSYSLSAVGKLHMMLNVDSFSHQPPLKLAFEALEIPLLVTTCFDAYRIPKSLHLLEQLTATADDPVRVLTCLVANVNKLQCLSSSDCLAVLRYFEDNMKKMKQSAEDWWVKENLRYLPLFLTPDNKAVSLTHSMVFVLPHEMPNDGVADLAVNTGLIILKELYEFEKLYKYLGCASISVTDIYLDHILRSAQHMNNSDIMKHVQYMRTILLVNTFGEPFSRDQEDLISSLKHLPFVTNCSGRQMKASELKNPQHAVFQLFCSKSECPAAELQEEDWIKFLLQLGLQNTMTGELYLQYAEQLRSEGRSNLNKTAERKSKILVTHLFRETRKTLDGRILQQLASIKFIVPFHVEGNYSNLHKQKEEPLQMISFAGSVIQSAMCLCWTSANILPYWAEPPKISVNHNSEGEWFDQHLGCHRHPTKDMAILHCQNIGESLKQKLSEMEMNSTNWINELMEEIYTYLKDVIDDEMRGRLYRVPLVYYPDSMLIYPAFQVVQNCSESEEVKPYLQRPPPYYGKFFDVFVKLGAAEQPQCHHYAQVLCLIKEQCGTNELNPNEFVFVAKAVINLLQCLKSSQADNIDLRVDHLYLPNRQHSLEESSSIVVSNNWHIENRIKRRSRLNYFVEIFDLTNILKTFSSTIYQRSTTFEDDPLLSISAVRLFKKLKDKYQPLILSELVKEELDLTGLSTSVTALSIKLESLLQNPDFIQGILRLIQQTAIDTKNVLSAKEKDNIVACFQNTIVLQASGINTYLLLKYATTGWERVQESVKSRVFHYSQERTNSANHYTLYFEADRETSSLPMNVERGLVKYFNKIAKGMLAKHELDVAHMLKKIDRPDEIGEILDEFGIAQHGSHSLSNNGPSPKPGVYVPVKYHAFLDNEFGVFADYERCVAYEKEDPCLENDNSNSEPTYIYAAIICKVDGEGDVAPMFQLYMINIGEAEYITVPAYRLYRFLRKPNAVRELVPADSVPGPSQDSVNAPLQQTYREIRSHLSKAWTRTEIERKQIMKRLYLKWHPDKNPGNEEYCTQVFQYIQQCIYKLEQGIALEDSEDETDGFSRRAQHQPNFTSSQYNTFFTNMNQRSHRHQRFYEEEASRCNSSSGSGNYFYHADEHEPYHYPEEADRWQRQAKSDCQDARLALLERDSPAYNWVCYRCHQAAEKSLKAAWYSKDANKMTGFKKNTHSLCDIAQGLDNELLTLAGRLSVLTGNDTRMRYPDMHSLPKIPATAYDRQCAEEVCGIADNILTVVSDTYHC